MTLLRNTNVSHDNKKYTSQMFQEKYNEKLNCTAPKLCLIIVDTKSISIFLEGFEFVIIFEIFYADKTKLNC